MEVFGINEDQDGDSESESENSQEENTKRFKSIPAVQVGQSESDEESPDLPLDQAQLSYEPNIRKKRALIIDSDDE